MGSFRPAARRSLVGSWSRDVYGAEGSPSSSRPTICGRGPMMTSRSGCDDTGGGGRSSTARSAARSSGSRSSSDKETSSTEATSSAGSQRRRLCMSGRITPALPGRLVWAAPGAEATTPTGPLATSSGRHARSVLARRVLAAAAPPVGLVACFLPWADSGTSARSMFRLAPVLRGLGRALDALGVDRRGVRTRIPRRRRLLPRGGGPRVPSPLIRSSWRRRPRRHRGIDHRDRRARRERQRWPLVRGGRVRGGDRRLERGEFRLVSAACQTRSKPKRRAETPKRSR